MNVTVKQTKKASDSLREKLMPLTRINGSLSLVLLNNDEECIFVAYNRNGTLIGWSCVYELLDLDKGKAVGVFVKEKYRHKGVGSLLKARAIRYCLEKNNKSWWWDRNTGDWKEAKR